MALDVFRMVGFAMVILGGLAHVVLLLREMLGFRGSYGIRVSTESSLLLIFFGGLLLGPWLLRPSGPFEVGLLSLIGNYLVLQGAVVAVLVLIISIADVRVARSAQGSLSLVWVSVLGSVVGTILLIAIDRLNAVTFLGLILLIVSLLAALAYILKAGLNIPIYNSGRLVPTFILGLLLGLFLTQLPQSIGNVFRNLPIFQL